MKEQRVWKGLKVREPEPEGKRIVNNGGDKIDDNDADSNNDADNNDDVNNS